jgi:hypothetical protein
MDSSGKNLITPQELINNFNAAKHPDVSAGVRAADVILKEFLDTFDVGGVEPGMITREEFVTYYHNLITSINDDDYIELVIRRTWNLGEDPSVVDLNKKKVIDTFVQQARRPSSSSVPIPVSTGFENSLKGRFSTAKTFGDEHWNAANEINVTNPTLNARPSTAGCKFAICGLFSF